MAEADDMQSVEALLRRVDALDGNRDAYAVALEVRDILDAGLDLLYRGDHRGELPRNPKLPERMGARRGPVPAGEWFRADIRPRSFARVFR